MEPIFTYRRLSSHVHDDWETPQIYVSYSTEDMQKWKTTTANYDPRLKQPFEALIIKLLQ